MSNIEISTEELKLLVNTLTKSVAMSLRKRYKWLWLFAGVLFGISITLAAVSLTWKKTDKMSATSKTLLKKTEATISTLQQINLNVGELTREVNRLNKKKQNDDQPRESHTRPAPSGLSTPATQKNAEHTGLISPRNSIPADKYMVYLHYTNTKSRKLMERLSIYLKDNGFRVPGIQRVNYNNRDIRYFHDEDKEGALLLKKDLTKFIAAFGNSNNENIRIKNLSRKYPDARKGALEVWANF